MNEYLRWAGCGMRVVDRVVQEACGGRIDSVRNEWHIPLGPAITTSTE